MDPTLSELPTKSLSFCGLCLSTQRLTAPSPAAAPAGPDRGAAQAPPAAAAPPGDGVGEARAPATAGGL